MKSDVTIVIPLAEEDGARQRAWRVVNNHLLSFWDKHEDAFCFAESGPNPARNRNRGARYATVGGVLVFNDADTLVRHDQMDAMIGQARLEPGLVFGFDTYLRLSANVSATIESASQAFESPATEVLYDPPSHGCVAIQSKCFFELGGYDERLEAYEDCAFNIRATERWPIRRVPGEAIHLWHPRLGDPGTRAWDERYAASREIYEREYLGQAVA